MDAESHFRKTGRLPAGHFTVQLLGAKLKELKPREPIVVTKDKSMQDAVDIMRNRKVGSMLVCDEDSGELLGIFTERDVLYRGNAGQGWNFRQHTVEEIMSTDVSTFSPEDNVAKLLGVMLKRGYRHFPIVDESHCPIGILSVRDLLNYVCDLFPEGTIPGQ